MHLIDLSFKKRSCRPLILINRFLEKSVFLRTLYKNYHLNKHCDSFYLMKLCLIEKLFLPLTDSAVNKLLIFVFSTLDLCDCRNYKLVTSVIVF